MDASAYLKGHGWRGLGYSLDQADRGLKKPLLVSQKIDSLGVGKQKHAQADQWWLRAFDESLKQIGTGQKTLLGSIREHGVDRGSLYGFFVKGSGLDGTISETNTVTNQDTTTTDKPIMVAHASAEPAAHASAVIPTAADILAKAAQTFTPGAPLQVEAVVHEKRKLEKEPRAELRKRRKLEKTERGKENEEKNREKAIAEGTFDYEAEELKRKLKHVNQVVKREIGKRLMAGEFGPILPHPNSGKGTPMKKFQDKETGKVYSYKAEKYKREKNRRVAQAELKEKLTYEMYPEIAPPSLKFGASKEDVLAYEAAQKKEKKAARAAKREKEERATATKEQERLEKLAAKQAKREARKAEKIRIAEGIAELKAKQSAGEDVSELLRQSAFMHAEGITNGDKIQNGTSINGENGGTPSVGITNGSTNDTTTATSSDEIKFGLTKKGRQKKIPGVGPVERYPTKAEKRQKKLESGAFAAGLTLEEYQARLDKEKWDREEPERKRVAEVQAARGGMTSREYRKKIASERDAAANAIYLATGQYPLPGTYDAAEIFKSTDLSKWQPRTVDWEREDAMAVDSLANQHQTGELKLDLIDLSTVSEKKRKQYTEKAAEKGVSVEDFVKDRNDKKLKAAQKLTQPKAAAAPSEDVSMGFVVDTVGDSSLGPGAAPTAQSAGVLNFVIDTAGNEALKNAKVGDQAPLRWHPDMLGSRKIKELTKAERAARLAWMRARRVARHTAAGVNPMSKKERRKNKMERKAGARNRLVFDLLKEKAGATGKPPGEKVSKEELMEARRAAKRKMREEKKIKRNKAIHRKNETVTHLISLGRS